MWKNIVKILFLLSLGISGCLVLTKDKYDPILPDTKNFMKYNFALIYNPSKTTVHPKFLVFNENDSITKVYNYIYLPELLFINKTGVPEAKIHIKYNLITNFREQRLIDSISKVLVLKKSGNQQYLTLPISFKVRDTNFLIAIYFRDLYRRKHNVSLLRVDRGRYSAQNFLLTYSDFQPVMNTYGYVGQKYVISTSLDADKIYVHSFSIDTTFPKPPFFIGGRSGKYRKDSVFSIKQNEGIVFRSPGFYVFSVDSNEARGKSILVVDDADFPNVRHTEQMLKMLVYITSTNEYRKLLYSRNSKIALDSFWLESGGSPEVARQLIRAYYFRATLANIFFTSYKEGWRTDRGMIYIVFGPPRYVYLGEEGEIWVYFDPEAGLKRYFYFKLVKRSSANNDYVLQPDPQIREFWRYAVSKWRSGVIPTF